MSVNMLLGIVVGNMFHMLFDAIFGPGAYGILRCVAIGLLLLSLLSIVKVALAELRASRSKNIADNERRNNMMRSLLFQSTQ